MDKETSDIGIQVARDRRTEEAVSSAIVLMVVVTAVAGYLLFF